MPITSAHTANRVGVTVFFTGLPASGKSTLARALATLVTESAKRPVTLLDGDEVRRHLSSELGYSREHRDLNILRLAFVAAEVTRHGGVAICAAIAPYRAARRTARAMISACGGFVEVYVSTPLAVCEARDPKGMYAKAHAGLIERFTGVSDAYEAPERPEIDIDTSSCAPSEATERIFGYLSRGGYLALAGEGESSHSRR